MNAEEYLAEGNRLHLEGKDLKKAIEYYLEAARLGLPKGYLSVAWIYRRAPVQLSFFDKISGKTVSKDLEKFEAYCKKAINADYEPAYEDLIKYYTSINDYTNKHDYQNRFDELTRPRREAEKRELEAARIIKQKVSADAGDRDAQRAMAKFYRETKQLPEALNYLKLAYHNTDPDERWGGFEGSAPAKEIIKRELDSLEQWIQETKGINLVSQITINEQGVSADAGKIALQPTFLMEDEFKKLDSMIGLDGVKEKIKELSDVMKMRALRQSHGLSVTETSLHLAFTGNSGTGKTTVAETVGGIYRSLGFLSKGHVVPAKRDTLIGGYIGQSAIKTNEKIQEALDGVLFIDEVYSLIPDPNHPIDYAHEVIATLVEGMERYRDRLAVVVAGYKSKMPAFLASNPGLPSRFPIQIDFPDYNPEELTQIFQKFASDKEYEISPEDLPELREHFETVYAMRGDSFANGRTVRNLFEAATKRQATRVLQEGKTDKASVMRLNLDDLGL